MAYLQVPTALTSPRRMDAFGPHLDPIVGVPTSAYWRTQLLETPTNIRFCWGFGVQLMATDQQVIGSTPIEYTTPSTTYTDFSPDEFPFVLRFVLRP
jgi:hypothetical protein